MHPDEAGDEAVAVDGEDYSVDNKIHTYINTHTIWWDRAGASHTHTHAHTDTMHPDEAGDEAVAVEGQDLLEGQGGGLLVGRAHVAEREGGRAHVAGLSPSGEDNVETGSKPGQKRVKGSRIRGRRNRSGQETGSKPGHGRVKGGSNRAAGRRLEGSGRRAGAPK